MVGSSIQLHGRIGIVVLAGGQIALLAGSSFAATWFTPIMWTGLILFLDGLLLRWTGRSWITQRRREFPLLLMLSVLVWLLFEAYNLRLTNWVYAGVPENPLVRNLGYFWSFATIMPGVFLVAELIKEVLDRRKVGSGGIRRPPLGPNWLWWILGLALVTIPLAVPRAAAAYLFGPVWIGFIFLIDAVNNRMGILSFRVTVGRGETRTLWALLLAGIICGFLWEGWNYQAFLAGGAYWIYTFPEALRITGLTFGQMPLAGLLGFPPFAVELLVMYRFLRHLLGGDRIFGTHRGQWLGYS